MKDLDEAIRDAQAQYADLLEQAEINRQKRHALKLKLTGWLTLQRATQQLTAEEAENVKLKLVDGVVVQEV